MLFIRKKKLEEDIEKMREYTFDLAGLEESQKRKEEERLEKEAIKKHHQEQVEGFGFKDVMAMTIAILQILLPYFLLVFGISAILFLLYYAWSLH